MPFGLKSYDAAWPCCPRCCGITCCIFFSGLFYPECEATDSSEKLVNLYFIIRHHTLREINLDIRPCENNLSY
jgi:hypothetical protein